ncbi:hypothetical protein CEXT_426041 [Caerostris extrusa]|uniref:Uncharacterized protein n=1 Tax=Caerostris extrusa TaxID=172846 RepID=A0AAV4NZE7_CAEEX|nr:hypothetical protein CEXT_426041 [Caerostris extrusa]
MKVERQTIPNQTFNKNGDSPSKRNENRSTGVWDVPSRNLPREQTGASLLPPPPFLSFVIEDGVPDADKGVPSPTPGEGSVPGLNP